MPSIVEADTMVPPMAYWWRIDDPVTGEPHEFYGPFDSVTEAGIHPPFAQVCWLVTQNGHPAWDIIDMDELARWDMFPPLPHAEPDMNLERIEEPGVPHDIARQVTDTGGFIQYVRVYLDEDDEIWYPSQLIP